MVPKIHSGASHTDARGTLIYNNDFDVAAIKRVFIIENKNEELIRAWQGHKIEQRWFSAISGAFKIQLIAFDGLDNPLKSAVKLEFFLYSDKLDILHIPAGYLSSIQSLEEGSKLLVMANYYLNEIEDEYRFDVDFFA